MGTRLYVGNLSFSSTIDSVREAFERIGQVTDVHIVTDRATGQSRGFGFVTMGCRRGREGHRGHEQLRPRRAPCASTRPRSARSAAASVAAAAPVAAAAVAGVGVAAVAVAAPAAIGGGRRERW